MMSVKIAAQIYGANVRFACRAAIDGNCLNDMRSEEFSGVARRKNSPFPQSKRLFCFVAIASAALFALVFSDFVFSLLFYRRHVDSISENKPKVKMILSDGQY
jgi:hypothetical protein